MGWLCITQLDRGDGVPLLPVDIAGWQRDRRLTHYRGIDGRRRQLELGQQGSPADDEQDLTTATAARPEDDVAEAVVVHIAGGDI